MLKETDILKAVWKKLKVIYPAHEVYLDETKENFKTPCFFLKLIKSTAPHKKYLNYNVCTLYITFFPERPADAMEMYTVKDTVIEAFWAGIQVEERYIQFGAISGNTDGQDSDIAQITLPFNYYDAIPRVEPGYTMQQLHQSTKIKY